MQNFPLIALALVCLWLIVEPRVHTGILISAGLGALAIGLLALVDDSASSTRAIDLTFWGLTSVVMGLAWRYAVRPLWLRLAMRGRCAHACAKFFGFERRGERRSE